MIRETFECYISCSNWLRSYEKQRQRFFNQLPWVTTQAISYSEFVGTSSRTSDQRMAIIADKMANFDKKYLRTIKHCKGVVQICEIWIELATPENRVILEKVFLEGMDQEEVAKEIGFTQQNISKRLKQECARLEKM